MSLSLLSIMLDEEAYVDRWAAVIPQAKAVGAAFDQILVIDGGSRDNTVDRLRRLDVPVILHTFQADFAKQRNFGIECLRTDWILELDADEVVSTPLLAGIHEIVQHADRDNVDCIGIPRLNFHDGVRVAGPGTDGLDYQYRLHRRHCYWRGNVHEEIDGFHARVELKYGNQHYISHLKSTKRHEARNAYYRAIKP